MNDLKRNEDGIEMTLAISHFGPFYLTYLLFDLIKIAPEARIINVSSMVHYSAPDKMLDDIQCNEKSFGSKEQYDISKFMNVLFTQELSRRIAKYQNIKTVSLHPGIVSSNFGNGVWWVRILTSLCCCVYISNEKGARSSIHLST